MPKLDKGNAEDLDQLNKLKETYVGTNLYSLNDIPFNMSLSTDIRAIEEAGGIPIIIPQYKDNEELLSVLNRLDGILFAGGNDIDPELYGEEEKHNKGIFGSLHNLEAEDASVFAKTVRERDLMEMEMMRQAINHTNLPILAICRGIQVMNVAMGGTIYQDINACYENTDIEHSNIVDWDQACHSIEIEEDSTLFSIFNRKTVDVNTIHHQALKALGDDLKVVAKAPDGIIEAIEYKDKNRFILGVQWHPEMLMTKDIEQKRVLESFIEACKNK